MRGMREKKSTSEETRKRVNRTPFLALFPTFAVSTADRCRTSASLSGRVPPAPASEAGVEGKELRSSEPRLALVTHLRGAVGCRCR